MHTPRAHQIKACRAVITALIPHGHPNIENTAAVLGLSVRTLQRLLRAEGTSYSALLDTTRYAMACRLLADTRCKIVEVARTLGFRDCSSFSRAFLRWAGQPPRDYRRRTLAAGKAERAARPNSPVRSEGD